MWPSSIDGNITRSKTWVCLSYKVETQKQDSTFNLANNHNLPPSISFQCISMPIKACSDYKLSLICQYLSKACLPYLSNVLSPYTSTTITPNIRILCIYYIQELSTAYSSPEIRQISNSDMLIPFLKLS